MSFISWFSRNNNNGNETDYLNEEKKWAEDQTKLFYNNVSPNNGDQIQCKLQSHQILYCNDCIQSIPVHISEIQTVRDINNNTKYYIKTSDRLRHKLNELIDLLPPGQIENFDNFLIFADRFRLLTDHLRPDRLTGGCGTIVPVICWSVKHTEWSIYFVISKNK